MENNARIVQLQSFLEADPYDPFTLYSLGHEYQKMEQWSEAVRYYELIKKHNPSYLGIYYHWGRCLQKIGDRNQAAAIYEEGISQAEKAKDAHALAELRTALLNMDYEEEA